MKALLQAITRILHRLRCSKVEHLPPSGVLLHDPAALRPHDLDDPFFDSEVQRRLADVIAEAALKKKGNKDAAAVRDT